MASGLKFWRVAGTVQDDHAVGNDTDEERKAHLAGLPCQPGKQGSPQKVGFLEPYMVSLSNDILLSLDDPPNEAQAAGLAEFVVAGAAVARPGDCSASTIVARGQPFKSYARRLRQRRMRRQTGGHRHDVGCDPVLSAAHTVLARSSPQTPQNDVMGKDAVLFHCQVTEDASSMQSQYVAQVRMWFDSMWGTISREVEL